MSRNSKDIMKEHFNRVSEMVSKYRLQDFGAMIAEVFVYMLSNGFQFNSFLGFDDGHMTFPFAFRRTADGDRDGAEVIMILFRKDGFVVKMGRQMSDGKQVKLIEEVA